MDSDCGDGSPMSTRYQYRKQSLPPIHTNQSSVQQMENSNYSGVYSQGNEEGVRKENVVVGQIKSIDLQKIQE